MTTSPTHSDGDFADAMDGSEQQQLSTDHPSSSTDDSPASIPLPDSRHGSVTSEVPRDVSSDQSYQSQRHASSSSATGSKAAPRTAPGVAALMARFQKGMSSSSTSSVTSSSSVKTDSKSSWSQSRDASGSTGQRSPDASGSASQKSLDAPVSTGQASLDDPREAQSIDAPVADQTQSIDAISVPGTHTEGTTATKGSTDGSRDVASVTSDDISSADPDNTHAQKLAPDETKIPPSEGAVSLLDPQKTIENPFHSDDLDETSISSDTNHNLQSPPSTPKPSSAPLAGPNSLSPSRGSITSSVADSTNTMSPHSTTRFSEISLSSGVPARASYAADPSDSSSRRSSKRATVTTMGERETLADPLEEAKRFSSQDKDLPAPSLEGMEKLRENFEKLHQQQQQKRNSHSRQHSNATDPSEKGHPGPSSLREEVQANSDLNGHLTGDTTITTLDQDSEEVDWDFWGKVMSNYHEVAHENPHDLSRAIQAGIPAQLRGLCWQLLSASKDEEMEIIYAYYIRQNSPHEKQIRKDLSRTFPQQDYFKDVKGVGQDNLFNVVKAYSLYDEECGYCQGMQFIVGPLLMHMPDEEAFSTLVRLMKSYGLRGHFVPNMPGLQLRLFQFDRLLEDILPLLHRHLTRQGIKASMYASQWFMTLFSYRFPLDFVYRVLDSVFAEGLEAVFRFALSLMKKSEDTLLDLNFEQALAYLKGSDIVDRYKLADEDATTAQRYDVDAFARDAFSVQVTPYMLDGYATEFEESVRVANAHRREVEALRLVNRNLAARVAALEEQLQQISAEHVDLVKQAVMSKVAKEEMEEDLIRYKMLFAEASLRADQAGESRRTSSHTSMSASEMP